MERLRHRDVAVLLTDLGLALGEEGLADYGALPKADSGAKFEGELAGYPIKDFYLTNPIARASEVMQRCSDELLHGADVKEAAE